MTARSAHHDSSQPFPERVGRYELLLPIASGGMATVYLARVTGLAGFEREVAVKLTHEHLREEPGFMTALIDEARFAGRIHHPNVVSVHDVAECEHGVFVVMDYIEGDSLAGIVHKLTQAGRRIPIEISLRILDEMLAGLHAAHELRDPTNMPLRLVHRDVTPHNVLLGVDGATRLTDFGVATAARRLSKTQTGLVKGKLAYMSPEQVRARPLDRTCDVWAAGVVAWELFTGHRMYEGFNDAALLLKIANDEPTPLRYMRPDIPPEIDQAVAGALTLSKTARYPSAEAFADALAHAARQAGIVPADVRAMRAFVTPVVEGVISARRAKLAQVYANRHGIRPAPPPPVAADGPVTMALPPPSVPPPRPSRPDAAPRPSSSSITATDTDRVSSPPELTAAQTVNYGPVSGEQTATLGTGVELSDPRPSTAPPGSATRRLSQHPFVWIAAGAALLLASVVVIVVVLRSGSSAAKPAQGTEDGTLVIAPPSAALSATPAATASAAADASDIPVVDPNALPVAEDEPDAAKKRAAPWRHRAPVRPPPKEEPKPVEPTPLGNPY